MVIYLKKGVLKNNYPSKIELKLKQLKRLAAVTAIGVLMGGAVRSDP